MNGAEDDPIVGKELKDGWVVKRRLSNPTTGGCFSIGYVAEGPDGDVGFVKVLDLGSAQFSTNMVERARDMTTAFSYERLLLDRCSTKRMSRVVKAIQEGDLDVPEFPINRVPYLLFEYAETDVRRMLDAASLFDFALRVRWLHHVATGLQQLHSENIAHQDLKPSNVLVFGELGAKLGDLGRASMLGEAAPHDGLDFAGDPRYAPPEAHYGVLPHDFRVMRVGADLFQLANLAYFLFEGIGLWPAVRMHLDRAHFPGEWKGEYVEVLPHLQRAFTNCLNSFGSGLSEDFRVPLLGCMRELGNPDPQLRGLAGRGGHRGVQINRYVSKFDSLASALEVGLLKAVKE